MRSVRFSARERSEMASHGECPLVDSDVAIELASSGNKGRAPVALAHEDRCIRCGGCIVQCPLDALAFEDEFEPSGAAIGMAGSCCVICASCRDRRRRPRSERREAASSWAPQPSETRLVNSVTRTPPMRHCDPRDR